MFNLEEVSILTTEKLKTIKMIQNKQFIRLRMLIHKEHLVHL